MNREDIIAIAREAGMGATDKVPLGGYANWIPLFERFANLVAERERKECAKVCLDCGGCREAIRARSVKLNTTGNSDVKPSPLTNGLRRESEMLGVKRFDLLTRLRHLSFSLHDDLSVAAEAADEIESLREQLAAVTKERDCLRANLSKAEYDRDACQKDAEIWRWVVGGQTLFTVCEWVEDGGYGHFAGVEEVEDAIIAAMKEQTT